MNEYRILIATLTGNPADSPYVAAIERQMRMNNGGLLSRLSRAAFRNEVMSAAQVVDKLVSEGYTLEQIAM